MTSFAVRSYIYAAGLAVALLLTPPVFSQTDELQDVNQMLKVGQFDQALTRVNSYLSTRPKDARGRFLKGLILAEQNKPNDAIKVFSELTQDFPDLPGPYNNLAVLYAAQGQYDKARGALEQAIRTHPSYATAHENLGDIYAKMASQAYDKALQLDKSNTTAQTKLNMIRDLFPADPRSAKIAAGKVEPAKVAAAPVPAPPPYDPTKAAPAPPTAKPAPVTREPEPATKPSAKMRDPDEVMAVCERMGKVLVRQRCLELSRRLCTRLPHAEGRAPCRLGSRAQVAHSQAA